MTSDAGKEAMRQTIALIFSLVGTAATVVIVRYAANPDAFRELRMRIALHGKRWAQREADRWQSMADRCATWYNEGKA